MQSFLFRPEQENSRQNFREAKQSHVLDSTPLSPSQAPFSPHGGGNLIVVASPHGEDAISVPWGAVG